VPVPDEDDDLLIPEVPLSLRSASSRAAARRADDGESGDPVARHPSAYRGRRQFPQRQQWKASDKGSRDPIHPTAQWREPLPNRRRDIDRRLDLACTLADRDRSRRELGDRLDSTQVVVHVDPDDGEPAILAAAALTSMAARIVGQVSAPPLELPLNNPWQARTLGHVIEGSRLRGPTRTVERTITVGIGRAGGRHAGSKNTDVDIAMGGDDWTAVVARDTAVPIGPSPLGGMGLQVAAALAFGEVMKDLLGPVGMRHVPMDGRLVWNLVDGRLTPGPTTTTTTVHRPVTIPKVAILGAGSIGSSAAAVLSMTRLVGRVNVVDPDDFDPDRNAYRCPGVPAHTGGPKADWAARILAAKGWYARAHRMSVHDWAATRDETGFSGIALVSVDNVDGRREAGDLMAQTTISAGAGGAALHVQRHLAGDDLACPYCEFVDAKRWREQATVYARLGLTLPRLEELLDGAPLTADDVATAIWTGSIDPRSVHDLPGGHLGDLLARHYATIGVPASVAPGRGPTGTARVSAPHVSWLAGALMATEVVKQAFAVPGLERRVEADLTGVPLGGWRRPHPDASGRCPCTRPDRRELARTLYADGSPAGPSSSASSPSSPYGNFDTGADDRPDR
jgi:hypothetical protein